MATPPEDVEQLLAAKVVTPIAQLSPDLPDQGNRKLHGEVTITWPYSSVTKSFAFLLAEPDFRLRRDRGSVRIQLSGPSAEAVGGWELGSGDEVVLALNAVEWAKDEEPARPAGSRLDWQLKFAGRLMLKATLGETQETKFLNIDQPFAVQKTTPEVAASLSAVEVDTAVLVDEPVATPTKPFFQTAPNGDDDEYSSPIFAKRSRSSYGPLFELNLDDELEADGGRRGKGRKRPRYSVQNRMWKYREDSSSPEPEASQDSPSAAQAQNGNVSMQDTPTRVEMTDGEAQTNEFELPPPPSSSFNTPVKNWGQSQASSPFPQSVTQAFGPARTDTAVQAAPWKPAAAMPKEYRDNTTEHAQSSNPFDSRSTFSPSPRVDSHNLAGFGVSQGHAAPVSPESGQISSTFGTVPNDGMRQVSSAPNDAGSAHDSSPSLEAGPNGSADRSFGAASSLFGIGPAPTQPTFSQAPMASSGFGVTGGSLRFGFGQEPRPSFGGSPFTDPAAATDHPDAHPYPESYLDQQNPPGPASLTPQNPFVSVPQDAQPLHGLDISAHQDSIDTRPRDHSVPLWPLGSQNYDDRHAVAHVHPPEDLRADDDIPEVTPPGIISPEVDDGTRNADEMRHEGLLSIPVYRQGVPQEALPDHEDASADEDEDAMDSDEEADYDEDQKGDDYDLRNYDRLSDDEEGFDEDEPLSGDELLEEDEQPFYEGDRGFDHNDYDEEDYEDDEAENYFSQASRLSHQPRPPPQPAAPKQPVVIDLLSDSDDDEPPAKSAVQSQPPQKQTHQPASLGLVRDQGDRLTQASQPPAVLQPQPQDLGSHQEEDASEEESQEDLDHDAEDNNDHSEDAVEETDSDEGATAGSDNGEADAESDEIDEDVVSVRETNVTTVGTVISVAEVEEASTPSPGRTHGTAISGSEAFLDHEKQDEITTADVEHWMRRHSNGPKVAMDVDEERVDDGAENFQSQVTDMGNHSPISQDEEMADDFVEGDNLQGDISAPAKEELEQGSASPPTDATRQDAEEKPTEVQQKDTDEDAGEKTYKKDVEAAAVELVAESEAREPEDTGEPSDQQQDAPPSPPESQEHQVDAAAKVDVVMTAVSEYVETRVSEQDETLALETQQTDSVFHGRMTAETDGRRDPRVEDVKMVNAAEEHIGAEDIISEEIKAAQPRSTLEREAEDNDSVDLLTAEVESAKHDMSPVSARDEDTELPQTPAAAKQRRLSPLVDDDARSGQGGHAHDASAKLNLQKSSPVTADDVHASFVTTTLQVSDAHEEPGEVETTPSGKPKRGGRKTRGSSSSKAAKSSAAPRRGQRQVSSEQAPGSQRTTRSKAMSFQKASSPEGDKEDMSIQLARAALMSPTTKPKHKRKVSASSAKREKTSLVKRLEDDMPDCAALKDLRKHNNHVIRLDVAVVATSAQTPPKRTVTREYASSFTVTDPSVAPDSVVEIDLYSLHRDHLPMVERGDSVLLRGFTVVSLPGRGFGLKTEKNESSWGVFKAGGDDEPEMRAAPVELNDKEKKYLLDLRAWYAGLDEGAKDTLNKAVDEIVENGRESRVKT